MYKQNNVAYQPLARLRMAFRSKKRKRSSLALGVIATLLASLSFTFMSACAKALAPLSSGELTFFRGIVGLFLFPFFAGRRKRFSLATPTKACCLCEVFSAALRCSCIFCLLKG